MSELSPKHAQETQIISQDLLKQCKPIRYAKSTLGDHLNLSLNKIGFKLAPTATFPVPQNLENETATNETVIVEPPFLNFTESNFEKIIEIFFQFIPEISFVELHHLFESGLLAQTELSALFQKCQTPYNEKTKNIFIESKLWPIKIQEWVWHRKIKAHELTFMLQLSFEHRLDLLTKIADSKLSKSQQLQVLEWASELYLMKVFELPKKIESEKEFQQIRDLRFPKSFIRHPIQQMQLKWPPSVQSQFQRQRDKAGFQIQFFITHHQEFEKILQQLQAVHSTWENMEKFGDKP